MFHSNNLIILKIAEFRTPTTQDVRKKGSEIVKLPSVRNCFTLTMTNKLVVIINSLKQRFPYFLHRGALFRTEIRRGALSSPLNQRNVCAYLAVFT